MEGLKNFALNIKPLMFKLRTNEKLTKEEKEKIVQFYLEVINVVTNN